MSVAARAARRGRVAAGLLGVLVSVVVLAACGAPVAPGAGPKPAASGGGSSVGGDETAGKQLFSSKGCIACHVAPGVPGATGTIGPSLAGIGDAAKRPKLTDGADNTPERVKAWIQDPQGLKPGTMMPNLQLSDKESSDLTAFLLTLK